MTATTTTATAPAQEKKRERKYIPFLDSARAMPVILHAVESNIPVLLIGETGTGKTTCIRDLARKHKRELIRVSLNGATSVEEIIGKWILKNNETVWINGVLTNAMEKGHWIVFDEINAALAEILFTLHSVLDDDRKLLIAEQDGRILRPHPDFRFFATMNPCINYAGTKELNSALLSRFGVVIQMPHLTPAREQKLLQEYGDVPEETAGLLTHTGVLLRKAWEEEKISFFCSTRDLLQAANLVSVGMDIKRSVEVTIVNKGETHEERNEIRNVIKEILELQKEHKIISYINTEQVAGKLLQAKEMAVQLAYERDEARLIAQREREKAEITSQQRDILWEILQKYIQPFIKALAEHCKAMSEDKERTEEARKQWRELAEKAQGRLEEIRNGENKVKELEKKFKEIEQRFKEGEKEARKRQDAAYKQVQEDHSALLDVRDVKEEKACEDYDVSVSS